MMLELGTSAIYRKGSKNFWEFLNFGRFLEFFAFCMKLFTLNVFLNIELSMLVFLELSEKACGNPLSVKIV